MAEEETDRKNEEQVPVLADGASGDPLNPAEGVPGYLAPPSLTEEEPPHPPQTPTGPEQTDSPQPSPTAVPGSPDVAVQPSDSPQTRRTQR